MAKCTKDVTTIVETIEKTVPIFKLELTVDEARILRHLLGLVSGFDSNTKHRINLDAIWNALARQGADYYNYRIFEIKPHVADHVFTEEVCGEGAG